MSATRTAPASSAPGRITTPTFGAPNVTVRSARTASPSTAPVAPFTPDGMSTATTGAGDVLSPAIASAHSSSGTPRNPVPNTRVDRDVRTQQLTIERRGREAHHADRADLVQAERVACGRLPEVVAGSSTATTATRTPHRAR